MTGELRSALQLDEAGVTTAAMASEVGELFQYAISQPVTIGRQQSAMIPIVTQDIEGEKVSVYTESVNAKYPMNGIRLKNDTGLHLMAGPITVFDGGAYAGDALVDDLRRNEERLITYAVDLGTEVVVDRGAGTEEVFAAIIDNGVLQVSRRERQPVTYTLKNRLDEARSVLVEHSLQSGWDLEQPEKATETTRDMYRFAVAVPAGATEKLEVVLARSVEESVAMVDWNDPQLDFTRYSDTGVIGDPTQASAALGRKLWDESVAEAAAILRDAWVAGH